ncbi:MAG: hypothetical protein IT546_16870 [Caulobacteraceae bacterium]|nr:hypothetical protein [Caulobacteraceae bacterium]
MTTIEIDFEVFKALTALREAETVSCNDVLRRLLGLERAELRENEPATAGDKEDWVCKGVRFPAGTEFRASYKGIVHRAKVAGGRLHVGDQVASTPSDAARIVTKTNVNGWTFWECRMPGEARWRMLKSLRN